MQTEMRCGAGRWKTGWAIAALALLLSACASNRSPAPGPAASQVAAEAPPQPRACPAGLPADTRCLGGQDSAGAFYLIAMPKDWQGELVLHAHGGPFLGAPTMKRQESDLQRWAVVPRAGYAWAGSSYRQGGVAVRAAAEDTERLRRIFVQHVAQPKLTLLHGQSWGGSVAAKGAEMFDAARPYDAVLLTNGVLAGGTRAYDFRLDFRVVYQYLCQNHPRPDEPVYPLWMGLPAGSRMDADDLSRRANECLGLDKPAVQRSPDQARRLKTLLQVIRISESSVMQHLSRSTFDFRDIALHRSGGGSVFGNIGARYIGSEDDNALNAGVLRYAADPAAVARFAEDADLGGRISVPVLTLHGIHDTVAFVEMETRFAQTMAQAGHAATLVQAFGDHSDHSYLTDATYVGALNALKAWVQEGRKPTPASVAAACVAARFDFPSDCKIQPDYQPKTLESRVPVRRRP